MNSIDDFKVGDKVEILNCGKTYHHPEPYPYTFPLTGRVRGYFKINLGSACFKGRKASIMIISKEENKENKIILDIMSEEGELLYYDPADLKL